MPNEWANCNVFHSFCRLKNNENSKIDDWIRGAVNSFDLFFFFALNFQFRARNWQFFFILQWFPLFSFFSFLRISFRAQMEKKITISCCLTLLADNRRHLAPKFLQHWLISADRFSLFNVEQRSNFHRDSTTSGHHLVCARITYRCQHYWLDRRVKRKQFSIFENEIKKKDARKRNEKKINCRFVVKHIAPSLQ